MKKLALLVVSAHYAVLLLACDGCGAVTPGDDVDLDIGPDGAPDVPSDDDVLCRAEIDEGDDGDVERLVRYSYEAGRVVRIDTFSETSSGPGLEGLIAPNASSDYTETRTYNDLGEMVLRHYYEPALGEHFEDQYRYDDEGREVREETIRLRDGLSLGFTESVYDDDGHLQLETSYREGIAELETRYTYFPDGRLQHTEVEHLGPGAIPRWEDYSYVPTLGGDEQTIIHQQNARTDGDYIVETRNSDGRLLQVEHFDELDLPPFGRVTYIYDGDDVVRVETEMLFNGRVSVERRFYGATCDDGVTR